MEVLKTISLNLNLSISLAVNPQTNEVRVQNCDATIINILNDGDNAPNYVEHQINETENRYGILTLGAKSAVGMLMPTATEVKIEIDGEEFVNSKPIMTHRSTKGRIDGLTQLFRMFSEKLAVGSVVSVSYNPETSVLALKSK